MKKIIPILIFIVLTVASCKEDKPKPYENSCTGCHSVLEAKKFFAFKVGSWWVYEEETSGERDSLYVYESSIDTDSYQFNVRIKSEPSGYLYHYWPIYVALDGCDGAGPVQKKCLYVKRSKGLPGDFIGEGYVFFVNSKIGDYVNSFNVDYPNNHVITESIYNEYEVAMNTFDETYKMHELNSYEEGKQPANFYYSSGVGLIRKELIDSNEVWNLVNYYIAP